MNSALMTGIKTLANSVTGLSNSNFFYMEAKNTQESLYGVYYSINQDQTIDSGSFNDMDYVQFDFYGTNFSNLDTVVTAFETAFDLGTLSVTGYTHILSKKTFKRGPNKEGKMWYYNLEYRFFLSKLRS